MINRCYFMRNQKNHGETKKSQWECWYKWLNKFFSYIIPFLWTIQLDGSSWVLSKNCSIRICFTLESRNPFMLQRGLSLCHDCVFYYLKEFFERFLLVKRIKYWNMRQTIPRGGHLKIIILNFWLIDYVKWK